LKCDKAITVLLDSLLFKCFSCKKLVKISNRKTNIVQQIQLSDMFRNEGDINLLKINYSNNISNMSNQMNICGASPTNMNNFNINNNNGCDKSLEQNFINLKESKKHYGLDNCNILNI
jgi:hypothetical protein